MEIVEGSFSEVGQPEQPVVYPVDATKCKSLKEMGVLFNALGIAMTKEYAEQMGLQHILKVEE
jgi:hypothetical protein